jgi:sulfhydrogenase subunit gamma (sulfur reductase)
MSENIYKPYLMQIEQVVEETPDVRTFRLKFKNSEEAEKFSFKAGQFGEYSVFGEGESTFCVASSPNLEVGDTVGFRGPYGNTFPIEEWEGKNLLYIAGGIALPPMRCVIWNTIDLREKYKDITIVYGARSVSDLVYKQELKDWAERPDIKLITTVDPGGQTPDWKGEVGFVPMVLEKAAPSSENTIAILCGPPVMIKFTMPVLKKLGFQDKDIYTTLENRMKCGFGKCGRCNVGKVFVCKDGPVFSYEQILTLPEEY